MTSLPARVAQIAEATLADQHFVTPIDVMIGLGWLLPAKADLWLFGVVSSLDRCIRATKAETAAALDALRSWARQHDLQPWDTPYPGFAFTADGDPHREHGFRTRWAPTQDPAPKAPAPRSGEPTVLAAEHSWECGTCGEPDDLMLRDTRGGICPACAGLGHLVFLPAGDAALTRHAKKAARVSATVVRMNTQRMRRERLGILTEHRAVELAAGQCLADPDRPRRKATVNEQLRREITDGIRAAFPGCPPSRAEAIGYYAAVRGGGRRRGRSSAAQPDSVALAVTNSVRRVDTDYDDLYLSGSDHDESRQRVQGRVDDILDAWRGGATVLDP
ncbi:DUF2293 domain-containing protein [Mycolicibacterium vaccae]|uniref:DUF2293 domain-containing protein n=1 Tax=Mycolicibacterium vaccae ATCC 25954 TaxID=1194972 RepID=K0VBI8_MYCVA|nr:DUF2293 domain-containing protein [Mycolicibacterium vaccae]ANI38091.1 hypothetical protein MYVA_0845 [Mycolicibacterium vaccae 95051]EJZ12228.1 hypothetical protein MVAC_03191 [Mycolicibacterium vaccae ATCC 25954]MCV7060857.1 DUF2293 domain-containing protein [Mycolicibacterium vaccae]